MSDKKLYLMLEHLRNTHQMFCFDISGGFYTAEELLSRFKGHKVTFDQAVEYITSPIVLTFEQLKK
jgi:hypothetical protein